MAAGRFPVAYGLDNADPDEVLVDPLPVSGPLDRRARCRWAIAAIRFGWVGPGGAEDTVAVEMDQDMAVEAASIAGYAPRRHCERTGIRHRPLRDRPEPPIGRSDGSLRRDLPGTAARPRVEASRADTTTRSPPSANRSGIRRRALGPVRPTPTGRSPARSARHCHSRRQTSYSVDDSWRGRSGIDGWFGHDLPSS